jgi:rhodanese-related sulfurtransferase
MNYLDPKDAFELIDKNKSNPDFVLMDIRRKSDYEKHRIYNAVNMPYYNEDFDRKLKKLNRNKIYLIYCLSDSISNITSETMNDLGFKNINKISGGISNWHKSGLEIISSER